MRLFQGLLNVVGVYAVIGLLCCGGCSLFRDPYYVEMTVPATPGQSIESENGRVHVVVHVIEDRKAAK